MKNKINPYFLSLSFAAVVAVVFIYLSFMAKPSQPGLPAVKGMSTIANTANITKQDLTVDPSNSLDATSESTISQKLDEMQSEIDGINAQLATTTSVQEAYKLVSQIDSCSLNKLSKLGWRISQMGTIVNASSGALAGGTLDENCKSGPAQYIDWVVLQKP